LEVSDAGRVVGGIIYQFMPKNFEIVKFMVHPEFKDNGAARALIEFLKDKLSAVKRTYIDVVIDEYDLSSQQLFRANGFTTVDIIKEHFESLYETSDGYRLRYLLGETP